MSFPSSKKCYGAILFWSDSYFITTTGQVSLDVLKKYVEEQEVEPKQKSESIPIL